MSSILSAAFTTSVYSTASRSSPKIQPGPIRIKPSSWTCRKANAIPSAMVWVSRSNRSGPVAAAKLPLHPAAIPMPPSSPQARASTLQYRSLVSYTADNFGGHPSLGVQLIGFADKTQDIQTFTSVRYEGAFQVAETFSRTTNILYRYFFRRVTASQLRITQDEIPLFSQPTLVSGFGLTYARERRDNPADAKRGTFNTVDLSVASVDL